MGKIQRIYEIQSNEGIEKTFEKMSTHLFAHPQTKKWINLSKKEVSNPHFNGDLRRRLSLYRHGFLTRSDTIYDFEKYGFDQYLSDSSRYIRTPTINGKFAEALNNKLFTYWMLDRFQDRLPVLFSVVNGGYYYPTNEEEPTHIQPCAGRAGERVLSKLREKGAVVLKGIKGGRGEQIHLCKWNNGQCEVNGKQVQKSEFKSRINDLEESIVTEFETQMDYSANIYPETMNTIRILTMVDPETREPFIAIAVHRFGSKQSGHVDSWSQGGLCAEVDISSGTLSQGVQLRQNDQIKWHETHPDSDSRIQGIQVPEWNSIKQSLLKITKHINYIDYAGWDLLITGQGEFKIIEVNNYTDVDLLQVHRPLLADNQIRKFYRFHGVIG